MPFLLFLIRDLGYGNKPGAREKRGQAKFYFRDPSVGLAASLRMTMKEGLPAPLRMTIGVGSAQDDGEKACPRDAYPSLVPIKKPLAT